MRWTPDEETRARLERSEPVTLAFTAEGRQPVKHAMTAADLAEPPADLAVSLPPVPTPRAAGQKAKRKDRAKTAREKSAPKAERAPAAKPAEKKKKKKAFSLF